MVGMLDQAGLFGAPATPMSMADVLERARQFYLGRGSQAPVAPAADPQGIPSSWAPFTAAPAGAAAAFPGDIPESEQAAQAEEARRVAYSRVLGRNRRGSPAAADVMRPQSPVPFSVGMLHPHGVAWGNQPDMPPSTNDPTSGEPQVEQNGVPLPRPRPNDLGVDARISLGPGPNAPFSIAGGDGDRLPPNATSTVGATPPAPPSGGGGFDLSGMLGKVFNPANAPLLLALGGGLSGAPSLGTGIRRASTAAAPYAQLMRKEQIDLNSKADTYRALVARGVPPQEALAAMRSPEILKALISKHFETKNAQVVNNRLVRERPDGTVEVLADYSNDERLKPAAGYRWVDPSDHSKGQTHIVGGPADPVVKAQSAKLSNPPSYEWVDPNDHSKGQRAVLGGPAEKVDAQVAARLGLAQSFMDQLPEIRRRVAAGDATGPWDAFVAKLGYGKAGELKRQIASGAEALLRNLTGAGMSISEAQKYVSRYELEAHDTADKVLSKLDQLGRELLYTDAAVRAGRGGTIRVVNGQVIPTTDVRQHQTPGAPPPAPGQPVDWRTYFPGQ